jgi:hypothetical protein
MKTLKSFMMGLALLLVGGIANAAPKTSTSALGKDEVVSIYLDAVVHGKLAGIDNAIDNDAQFNTVRGDNVNTLNKDQMLESLKSNQNIEQDCKCTNETVQEDNDTSIHKITMKYADFTRTDIVTSLREGKGWKITKVTTSYN